MSARRWGLAVAGRGGLHRAGAHRQRSRSRRALLPFVAAALLGVYRRAHAVRAERCSRSPPARRPRPTHSRSCPCGDGAAPASWSTASRSIRCRSPTSVRALGVTLHLFAILAGATPGRRRRRAVAPSARSRRWRPALARPASGSRLRPPRFGPSAAALHRDSGPAPWCCRSAPWPDSVALDHGVYDAADRYLLGAWCATVALLAGSARTRLRVTCSWPGDLRLRGAGAGLEPAERSPALAVRPAAGASARSSALPVAHGASVGYGGYWDVMPIGLAERSELQMVPIVELGTTGRWAGHFVAANSAWFAPHRTRSRSW